MASLQGLPPLPKSLSDLLSGDACASLWKIPEDSVPSPDKPNNNDINNCDICSFNDNSNDCNHGKTGKSEMHLISDSNSNSKDNEEYKKADRENEILAATSKTNSGDLQSSIGFLKDEMISLRQLDMSLLSQLWSLNEAIQDLKTCMHDRTDTNSECSSYSLDVIDEDHIYENESFHSQRYENIPMPRPQGPAPPPPSSKPEVEEEEGIYEPVYLEPQPTQEERYTCLSHVRPPPPIPAPAAATSPSPTPSGETVVLPTCSRKPSRITPSWLKHTASNTSYESSC